MPETRQNHSNAVSISSNGPVNNIQEGMMKMKIEENKEEGDHHHEPIQYPDRPGEPDCIFYLRTGACGYGGNCRFNHPARPAKGDDDVQTDQKKSELPQREGQPDCGYYLKTGTCKYGSTCKYHHPLDRRGAAPVTLNSLGLPLREEKPCPFYLRTKKCKYGQACKFDHPPLASDDAVVPVSGAASVGMGSAFLPNGMPYGGALAAWPWTRSPYVAPSHSPGPQTYMPFFIPPVHGALATQNWNSYLGNISAASHLMGSDLVYSSKNQGDVVNGVQIDFSNLPERPEQPECRYFISTGNCKYGASCRFHHPKERIPHSLGPHGLPLRPGLDICTHFSSYGICKYGPTCKFDHPLTGYISSYYFGMPSIPVLNQPFFPNPRNLFISNSTDASQSKSLKITDWIQKPENVGGKSRLQHSVAKVVEDSNEQVDEQSNAASIPTSEVPRDESD